MKQDTAIQNKEVADILSTMIVLSKGRFVIEAGIQLQKLTDAMVDTGKKGSITIKLEFTPSGLKDGRVNQFEIRPDITIQEPRHEMGKSIFFVDDHNKLMRDDPDQMEMGFEESEKETNGRR
jgi:hypothetical protein